jgi:serine/threonine protein phosphatase PrpC
MHQIKDSSSNVLLSGIFDGHGGDAASTFVSQCTYMLH